MKICYEHRQKARNGRLRDFASEMSPFLNRFLADVRLTHFHRSGTWLSPTDISQTLSPLMQIFVSYLWYHRVYRFLRNILFKAQKNCYHAAANQVKLTNNQLIPNNSALICNFLQKFHRDSLAFAEKLLISQT